MNFYTSLYFSTILSTSLLLSWTATADDKFGKGLDDISKPFHEAFKQPEIKDYSPPSSEEGTPITGGKFAQDFGSELQAFSSLDTELGNDI